MLSSEKKAGFILTAIAASEGTWVYFSLAGGQQRFWRYMGFSNPWGAGAFGWVLALLCTAFFVWSAMRLPSVRKHLIRLSWLKVLGLAVAGSAGLCEEAIFRKWLMDLLMKHGWLLPLQIGASALLFRLAHAVWGFFQGSLVTALRAMLATSILGLMLALVYVASHRILAPCIVAHFVTNLLIEPGLVLAAVRGEMSGKTFAAAA
ncbi:MAG TPA: CPBP family intramembrane glutamic endopeptidase [Candidatus Angelobacter sp.]|nr:CPBP family intramembrane glutamic endopeptidase [Candidatus Angelobacter sp.]